MEERILEVERRELILPEKTVCLMKSAALWGKILAILGFICAGLVLVFAVGAGIFGSAGWGMCCVMCEPIVLIVTGILLAALIFLPYFFLYRASVRLYRSAALGDMRSMNRAFESLKLYFLINAVLAVLGLLLMFAGMMTMFFTMLHPCM